MLLVDMVAESFPERGERSIEWVPIHHADLVVLMNTVLMLEDMRQTVFEAQSADEALSILRETPKIDFVITDHSMPKMTGAQLADEVSRLRPHVRLIFATACAELTRDAGVGLLGLTKPFAHTQLAAVIFSLVNEVGWQPDG